VQVVGVGAAEDRVFVVPAVEVVVAAVAGDEIAAGAAVERIGAKP
jgi:hypothetical protein